MATVAAGVAAGALALAAGGCGDDTSTTSSSGTSPTTGRTVDDAAIESQITKQLSTTGAQVTDATCPSDVQSKAGATFQCTVTWSNGATGKVKVTETSLNQFTYEPVSGSVQVPAAPVEQAIQEQLAKQGAPDAQVNCPDTIIVKVGTTVTCDLSSASGQANGTVTFTFSDATGTVDPSSVQAS